jgi:hypothetical protein
LTGLPGKRLLRFENQGFHPRRFTFFATQSKFHGSIYTLKFHNRQAGLVLHAAAQISKVCALQMLIKVVRLNHSPQIRSPNYDAQIGQPAAVAYHPVVCRNGVVRQRIFRVTFDSKIHPPAFAKMLRRGKFSRRNAPSHLKGGFQTNTQPSNPGVTYAYPRHR